MAPAIGPVVSAVVTLISVVAKAIFQTVQDDKDFRSRFTQDFVAK